MRGRFLEALSAAEKSGGEIPRGYFALRDWAGLDSYLESYRQLVTNRAALGVMGFDSAQPSMTPRAAEEQAFDYQTELEDNGH